MQTNADHDCSTFPKLQRAVPASFSANGVPNVPAPRASGISWKTAPAIHRCHVAIIGGGASGIALAIKLLRSASEAISIVIVNREGLPGRGAAYGTTQKEHLLNVAAGRMSILAEEPGHFLKWLSSRDIASPGYFAARQLYGSYLEDALYDEMNAHPASTVSWFKDSAISVDRAEANVEILLDSSAIIYAEFLVLATGNLPPANPPLLQGLSPNRYISNGWTSDFLTSWDHSDVVLILGSGLTAVDHALSLAHSNARQRTLLLSRHGLLPASHADAGTWRSDWARGLSLNVREILHQVREQISLAESKGVNWRAVIDSMRAASPDVWERLPYKERQRFIRHARPYWDVVRHRLPEHTHQKIMHLVDDRKLYVIAGRIIAVEEHSTDIDVTYRERSSLNEIRLPVEKIINCTGSGSLTEAKDGLINSLLATGLARADDLGLGLQTTKDGAVVSASGKPSDNIYAIGPVRKASSWETTAIGEIRIQAIELAKCIMGKLHVSNQSLYLK